MFYNKIIKFESDFVDGNRQKTLVQFSDIDIKPRASYIINITDNDKYYIDAVLSQISESNHLGGKMAYVVNDIFETRHVSLINDSLTSSITDESLKSFINGKKEYFEGMKPRE